MRLLKANPKLFISFGCTTAFFSTYLLIFRPGYAVNDDLSMISLVSGYLGGKPFPFMVFSNVIFGFLLELLYSLPSRLNWEILIFVLLNYFSVWALVYTFIYQPLPTVHKIAAVGVILASDSYILINLTFTTIATFAAISGFCLVCMGVFSKFYLQRLWLVLGALLIISASLIRIESVLLVFLATAVPIAILNRYFNLRMLVVTLGISALIVFVFYTFDFLYVRAFPGWNSYYLYNQTRSLLQDTPRYHLENIGNAFRDIGWSGNDYRLFVNWFFPDPKLYSLSNLQYLVEHTQGREKNIVSAGLSYFYPHRLFDGTDSIPYFLIITTTWLTVILFPSLRKAILPLLALLASFLILILYLIWTQKVPVHVWYSFLATVAVFGNCVLAWVKVDGTGMEPRSTHPDGILHTRSSILVGLVALLFLLVLYQAYATSKDNSGRQAAYRQILSALDILQGQGKIQPNALIVSPASGIPLEWSNPMVLELPKIQYLELGWLTFSPAYYSVLTQHGIQALPAGLYQKDDVYLMTRPAVLSGILQFIKDHDGLDKQADSSYSIMVPGTHAPDVVKIELYKLR